MLSVRVLGSVAVYPWNEGWTLRSGATCSLAGLDFAYVLLNEINVKSWSRKGKKYYFTYVKYEKKYNRTTFLRTCASVPACGHKIQPTDAPAQANLSHNSTEYIGGL